MTSTTVAVFALLLKHTSCKGYNTFAQLFHMTMTLTSYNETDDNHDDDDDDDDDIHDAAVDDDDDLALVVVVVDC